VVTEFSTPSSPERPALNASGVFLGTHQTRTWAGIATVLMHAALLIGILVGTSHRPWGTHSSADLNAGEASTATPIRLLALQAPDLPTMPAHDTQAITLGMKPDLSEIEAQLARAVEAFQPDSGAGTWRQALLDEVRWPDALLPVNHDGKVRIFWRRGHQGELIEWATQTAPDMPAAFVGHVRSGLDRPVGDPEAQHRSGCWTVRFDAALKLIELEVHRDSWTTDASACLKDSRAKRG